MNSQTTYVLFGTRFGDVPYTDEDILQFETGLVGFPNFTSFLLLAPKPESAFRWLQSIEEPSLAFLVTDPANYVGNYAPEVSPQTVRELELDFETPRMVLSTVNIPKGNPYGMTLNLAGPLLINLISRKGRQVVLEDEAYTTRHRVFETADRVSEDVAA